MDITSLMMQQFCIIMSKNDDMLYTLHINYIILSRVVIYGNIACH